MFVRLKVKSLLQRLKEMELGVTTPEEVEPIPEVHIYTAFEEVETMETANKVDDITKVEDLMDAITNFEFVMTSPIDGSPISVMRAEDVYRALCQAYNVDPKKTSFSSYA